MLSVPLAYLTYPAWASGTSRAGDRAATAIAPHPSKAPPKRPTASAPVHHAALSAIRNPPDPTAGVIADQERPVGRHEYCHRAAPARAVGELPAGDEIFDCDRPYHFPSFRMFRCSGGRLSVIAMLEPPMSSRSLLLAQSSPVAGLNARPTELRSPVANVCGLDPSRL